MRMKVKFSKGQGVSAIKSRDLRRLGNMVNEMDIDSTTSGKSTQLGAGSMNRRYFTGTLTIGGSNYKIVRGLITGLASLLLMVGIASAQSYQMRIDPQGRERGFGTLRFIQAEAPTLDVYVKESGATYTNLTGKRFSLKYAATATSATFTTITNDSSNLTDGYFRCLVDASYLNTNGTFWAAATVTDGTRTWYSGTGSVIILRSTVIGGASAAPFTSVINWPLYTYLGTPLSGPYRAGPGVTFTTNLDGSVTMNASAAALYLPLAGGTMSGDIGMGGKNLAGVNYIYGQNTNFVEIGFNGGGSTTRIAVHGPQYSDGTNYIVIEAQDGVYFFNSKLYDFAAISGTIGTNGGAKRITFNIGTLDIVGAAISGSTVAGYATSGQLTGVTNYVTGLSTNLNGSNIKSGTVADARLSSTVTTGAGNGTTAYGWGNHASAGYASGGSGTWASKAVSLTNNHTFAIGVAGKREWLQWHVYPTNAAAFSDAGIQFEIYEDSARQTAPRVTAPRTMFVTTLNGAVTTTVQTVTLTSAADVSTNQYQTTFRIVDGASTETNVAMSISSATVTVAHKPKYNHATGKQVQNLLRMPQIVGCTDTQLYIRVTGVAGTAIQSVWEYRVR